MAEATAHEQPQTGDATGDARPLPLTIGILVAHDSSKALAGDLADDLPDVLREDFPGIDWRTEIVETGPADPSATSHELLATIRRHLLDRGWSVAVGLTGLPLRAGRRPVTAYARATESVGLVSVPALGAVAVRRRLRDTVRHLVEGMLGESAAAGLDPGADEGRRERMHHRLGELRSPLGQARVRDDGTLRFAGAVVRGNLRLLVGMIRANEPATVVTRLSRAMIGALGTGVVALVSSNVWTLAGSLSWPRFVGIALLCVAITCVALIAAHHLWERAASPAARERVVLFNIATAATLTLGVLSLYVGLFVVFALAAGVVIPASQLGESIGHGAGAGDYLGLAWFVASIAVVGGALGSLAESDEAVRDAAYRAHGDERVEADD